MNMDVNECGASPPLSAAALPDAAPVLAAMVRDAGRHALFLDVDGTLIDIAPTPDAVRVPDGLGGDIMRLVGRLGGALALVTGRSIAFADRLFAPHRFAMAGLHGAELRHPDGRIVATCPDAAFLRAVAMLRAGARDLRDVVFEDKGAAVALHFRLAREHRAAVEALMREAVVLAGPEWVLQRGKMLVELKPAAADKGRAVAAFMRETPFAGRIPIAVGDDLTDEDMFAAAIANGGRAIRIGVDVRPTLASARFETPARLRAALASLAAA